ncbi:hypothetical protein G3142_005250 [Salmonella enterica subsp. enterica serovar Montevideo]|nr:hypothetical protein [Salmonella enterica subsp. enterica serovar Montevideo]EEK7814155.1 hypothetical protein [Salmonella enterica subsp. enterica serovar Montevideo]
MKLHKIAMIMACMVSTPALAWSNGDFNGTVDIGGSVTPEQYSQLWQWKVGTGLNNFTSDIESMTDNSTRLTIEITEPKAIFLGNTKSPVVAYNGAVGITPRISFTDFEDNNVTLSYEQGAAEGVGYFNLPVKNRDTNEKIGTVKVNAMNNAVSVSQYTHNGQKYAKAINIKPTGNGHLFYGALFSRVMSNATNQGDAFATKFGNVGNNTLKNVLTSHPLTESSLTWLSSNPVHVSLTMNGAGVNAHQGVLGLSYTMGIDAGQTLELTFDNPITSTTKWSAPLNVAVTYN